VKHRRAWIPLADGTRLAARLWLPNTHPAPALLEALPYRMDDLTASYSSEYERLCREGGLAVARVDLRGTGSSEGIAVDEYPPQEQADLAQVIVWLAAQRW
jgi:predicted acyl esterase